MQLYIYIYDIYTCIVCICMCIVCVYIYIYIYVYSIGMHVSINAYTSTVNLGNRSCHAPCQEPKVKRSSPLGRRSAVNHSPLGGLGTSLMLVRGIIPKPWPSQIIFNTPQKP